MHNARIFYGSVILLGEFNCLHIELSYKSKSKETEYTKTIE